MITKHTKKVHAESHRNSLNLKRIDINLNIPATASPDITTTLGLAVKHSITFLGGVLWGIRIEFITGTKEALLNATSIVSHEEGGGEEREASFVHYLGVTEAEVEAFDCFIPVKIMGNRMGKVEPQKVFQII